MGVSARLLLHRPLLVSSFRPRNPNPNPKIPPNLSSLRPLLLSLPLPLPHPLPVPRPRRLPRLGPPPRPRRPDRAGGPLLRGADGGSSGLAGRGAQAPQAVRGDLQRAGDPVGAVRRSGAGADGTGPRPEGGGEDHGAGRGSWKVVRGREEDGRERRLLFHTFSNTGWLTYGSILENWQSRSDLIERIDGCVVDSGPAPELSPQVWAAGFGAALLKKRSSLIYSGDSNQGDKLSSNDRPAITETIMLSILEKFFCVVLKLPEVNQRLSRIISTLSKNQPPCPQLYLYSSADKVVPASSVEGFIHEQKAQGKNVQSHDFVSSPHVDHFRSFPHIYSEKVNDFLKECLSQAVFQ